MPIKAPEFTSPSVRCLVAVGSTTANINIPITLTPAQLFAWSEAELATRIDTLKAAVSSFLSPGDDIQVNIMWTTNDRASTLSTSDTIE